MHRRLPERLAGEAAQAGLPAGLLRCIAVHEGTATSAPRRYYWTTGIISRGHLRSTSPCLRWQTALESAAELVFGVSSGKSDFGRPIFEN